MKGPLFRRGDSAPATPLKPCARNLEPESPRLAIHARAGKDGQVVSSVRQVSSGDELDAQVRDGQFGVTVNPGS